MRLVLSCIWFDRVGGSGRQRRRDVESERTGIGRPRLSMTSRVYQDSAISEKVRVYSVGKSMKVRKRLLLLFVVCFGDIEINKRACETRYSCH